MTDRARILQAVDRLAAALAGLADTNRDSTTPPVRLLLTPDQPTTAEARHMHAIGLTPEMAELLADTIERLAAHRATTHAMHAHAFAMARPELAKDIDDAFADIDPTEITRTVLDETAPENRLTVIRALDAVFGDVATEDDEEDED